MTESSELQRPDPLDLRNDALFLDLDGTLAPIVARPEDVDPIAARSALLRTLGERLGGRLAVISGRTIAEVDRILGTSIVAVAGVHGLERRDPDGRIERAAADPGLATVRGELGPLLRAHRDLLLEDKGLALAIHYRAAPGAAEAVRTAARRIAARTGLVIQQGDMVIELRGLGPRKGDAVNSFMRMAPFMRARPLFVGDDLTDEDGFAAVSALGGEGVLVGAARQTAARRRLDGVDAVMDWLQQAISGDVAA